MKLDSLGHNLLPVIIHGREIAKGAKRISPKVVDSDRTAHNTSERLDSRNYVRDMVFKTCFNQTFQKYLDKNCQNPASGKYKAGEDIENFKTCVGWLIDIVV